MAQIMEKALTFDDVCLIPQYNNINSRAEPDLSTWLTKDLKVGMPLIPSNMDSVISPELAEIIIANGGMPIFHRFTKVAEQLEWVRRFGKKTFVSCGLNESSDTFAVLDEGPAGVCIDVAHGHSDRMFRAIEFIKKRYPKIQVIAGNVCTAFAYSELCTHGADAVKVGVGPGAACTTRTVTGFGLPQFSAIQECAEMAEKLRVPIIADGGIRRSEDVAKALAVGASTVMIGKLFALTEESAAEKRPATPAGQVYQCAPFEAKYRGQASKDFQEEYYGGLKEKTVAEGTNFWAPVSGSAQALIDELLGGLRSGLTYGGAKSIKELQRKAEFRVVTPSYILESNSRRT
jgi:IMP dehydrogenase